MTCTKNTTLSRLALEWVSRAESTDDPATRDAYITAATELGEAVYGGGG